MGINKKSRVAVDVSSFLLFEATGDSEAGRFDPPNSMAEDDDDDHHHHVHDNDDDDDDAESCSCDTFDHLLVLPSGSGVGVGDQYHATDHWLEGGKANVDDVDDDDDDDDDGEVVEQHHVHHVHEKWKDFDQPVPHSSGGFMMAKESNKSAASVDSTNSMNEMEKSRLFWESCLAS